MDSERDAIRDIRRRLDEQAIALGFDQIGVSRAATDGADAVDLRAFLAAGRTGDMTWLEDKADRRSSPDALWPEAKSVISLGMNYGPRHDPLAVLQRSEVGAISVYAQGRDYHDVVKKRLKRLARWLIEEAGGEVKVFVDTAPVMEKPAAQRAGIGWQGKHTNLVSRRFGSWLFLGEIFTTLDLPPDEPLSDLCGSCDACREACPTDALPEPRRIDPLRCISYLTIEHKGDIPDELADRMGNRIYGCDDCLGVCPWNKFAEPAREPAMAPKDGMREPSLAELAALDDRAFRQRFSGSPIKRTGRDRFVRNVLIAIGNSGDRSLTDVAADLTNDPSPIVRDAARRAIVRLQRSTRALD
ncbi:MAG: tRNA epoxyqueuosine(34) reductase QueG [Rhodospirillales bacterium]